MPGAPSPSLVLTAGTRAHTGGYSVQVTGPDGTNTSALATLRVLNYPRLQPPQRLGTGGFRLHFGDHDGTPLMLGDTGNFEVWASPDLHGTNWVRANAPLTVTDGLLTFGDTEAPQHLRRFYRVIER